MSTVEAPEQVTDDGEVEDFVSHLYLNEHRWSLCGVHDSTDKHTQMHWDNKTPKDIGFRVSQGPGEKCPACGAPLCLKCKKVAEDMQGLHRMAMDAMRRTV